MSCRIAGYTDVAVCGDGLSMSLIGMLHASVEPARSSLLLLRKRAILVWYVNTSILRIMMFLRCSLDGGPDFEKIEGAYGLDYFHLEHKDEMERE